jgi:hypothetical protein
MIRPEPIPLGVCDPEGRIGAIARSQADIEVLDLVTGGLRQSLAATGSALMIDGGCLMGWHSETDDHRLRLFRLPLPPSDRQGERSPVFELPEWVRPRAADDTDFAFRFGRDGDAYSLFWRARRYYRGGVRPPPELQAEIARQVAAERIDFNVATLAVLRRRQQDGFAEDSRRARRGEELARDAGGMTYRQAGQLHNAPWVTPHGERFLRRLGDGGSGAQLVSLARGDAAADSIVSIRAVEPEHLVPELSLDGRHVAVVEQTAGAIVWSIYSALTGAAVGRFPYSDGLHSFRVLDRLLLYLEQRSASDSDVTIKTARTLHAMAMDSGKLVWSRALEPVTTPNRMFKPP